MSHFNVAPSDRFAYDVHVESHRRMRNELGDFRSFGDLSAAEGVGRVVMLGLVGLPFLVRDIQDELTIFQAELDIHGLTA